jgi:hypothetical protein
VPNPPVHAALAFELADRLGQPVVDRHVGALLLGATAPDIRAMLSVDREHTHFSALDSTAIDAGVEGLFSAHPRLAPLLELPEETQAFLLGYISHLVADQAWINTMYRPFFEDAVRFPDRTTANVMDRALQLEMDRQAAADVARALPLLDGAEAGIDVGFIEEVALKEWRERMETRFAEGFSWDRLRFMARRRQDPAEVPLAERVADEFLDSVSRGLEGLEAVVPWRRVEEYRALVLTESERLARRLIE